MIPMGKYLKVREKEKQTTGGLFVPETTSSQTKEAILVEKGEDVLSTVNEGATLLFLNKGVIEVKEGDKTFLYVPEDSLIAKEEVAE